MNQNNPSKMNVSEIKDQLRRSIPVPIKMLKLLDEEDESEDDDNYVTESFETFAQDPNEHENACKSDDETIESSDTASQEGDQQMVSEKENVSTSIKEATKPDGEVTKSVALENQVSTLSTTLESMKMSQQSIGITPVKQSTQAIPPVACNSNVFKTPECRQFSTAGGSKSVQSLLTKQNTISESHRNYNTEIKRRPLGERELGSLVVNSLQPNRSTYTQISSQKRQDGKIEETSTKRAIFPREQESNINNNVMDGLSRPRPKEPENKPKVPAENDKCCAAENPVVRVPKPEVIEKQVLVPESVLDNIPKVQCTIPKVPQATPELTLQIKDKNYRVLNVIGKGMSAEVLQVQDLDTRQLKAIKRVNLNAMDKECIKGCIDEINMLYKLQAPCVVRMYNYEVKQPYLFVIMELGETDLSALLKSIIQEKNKLPMEMIFHYWKEMLCAVKHIHDNGVIHSDLKPANFILVKGRLKLIDFGIASSISAENTSVFKESQTGTLNYISPEALLDANTQTDSAAHGKYKISRKSDVWSLGCILYCLVYGFTPFQYIRNQWQKISAITNSNTRIPFPNKRDDSGEGIPSALLAVMQKCLQHEPKARPSVDELLKIQYTLADRRKTKIRIPDAILLKIKNALQEDEWREFTEAVEK